MCTPGSKEACGSMFIYMSIFRITRQESQESQHTPNYKQQTIHLVPTPSPRLPPNAFHGGTAPTPSSPQAASWAPPDKGCWASRTVLGVEG